MIVVDTSVWIDYFRGIDAPHTNLLDDELSRDRVIIGDLIIAELLSGFRAEKDFLEAKKLLERLEYRDFLGKDIAIQAALNLRILLKKGIPVRKTTNVSIATFCIVNGFKLIHHDSDFDPMEKHLGLAVKLGPLR